MSETSALVTVIEAAADGARASLARAAAALRRSGHEFSDTSAPGALAHAISISVRAKCVVADALFTALISRLGIGEETNEATGANDFCKSLASTGATLHMLPIQAAVLHVVMTRHVATLSEDRNYSVRLLPGLTHWAAQCLLPAVGRLVLGDAAVRHCATFAAMRVVELRPQPLREETAPLLHAARLAALRAAAPPAPAGAYTEFPEGQALWGRLRPRRLQQEQQRGRAVAAQDAGTAVVRTPLLHREAAAARVLRALCIAALRSVHDCVADSLTGSAFDVVREWPESAPAVMDLRDCIAARGTRVLDTLSSRLVSALHARLLHAGAGTATILDLFVSACRALVAADPTGACLRPVAAAIRGYISTRSDAVRVVVSNLTAGPDAGSELYAELASRKFGRLGSGSADDDGDGDDGTVAATGDKGMPAEIQFELLEPSAAQLIGGPWDGSDEEGEAGGGSSSNIDASLKRFLSPSHAALALAMLLPMVDVRLSDATAGDRIDDDEADDEEYFDAIGSSGWLGDASSRESSGAARRGAIATLLPLLLPAQVLPTSTGGARTSWVSAAPFSARSFGLWMPPPRTTHGLNDGEDAAGINSGAAPASAPPGASAASDLLSAFVSVFGTPDLFTNEYRAVLAERLLLKSKDDFETDADDMCVDHAFVQFAVFVAIRSVTYPLLLTASPHTSLQDTRAAQTPLWRGPSCLSRGDAARHGRFSAAEQPSPREQQFIAALRCHCNRNLGPLLAAPVKVRRRRGVASRRRGWTRTLCNGLRGFAKTAEG